jgi:hypothetical protein
VATYREIEGTHHGTGIHLSKECPPIPSGSPIPAEGIVLWLDATELGLNDGDRVSRWEDQTEANNDLTASGDFRPTFRTSQQNNKPGVSFDQNELSLSSAPLGQLGSTGLGIFVVTDIESTNTIQRLYYEENDQSGYDHQTRNLYTGDETALSQGGQGQSDLSYKRIRDIEDYGAFTVEAHFGDANGLYFNNQRVDAVSSATDPETTKLAIGYNLGGNIYEVIVYRRALTPSERNEVFTYLDDKWAMDTSGPAYASAELSGAGTIADLELASTGAELDGASTLAAALQTTKKITATLAGLSDVRARTGTTQSLVPEPMTGTGSLTAAAETETVLHATAIGASALTIHILDERSLEGSPITIHDQWTGQLDWRVKVESAPDSDFVTHPDLRRTSFVLPDPPSEVVS